MNTETNIVNIAEAKWTAIQLASQDLDAMVTQTVIKACDIGDMLREERAKLVPEKFSQHLLQKLNRTRQWSDKLIDLSFRRQAVQAALANDDAPDSISGMHAHVKLLPRCEKEDAERAEWPREKRGPKPGAKKEPGVSYVQYAEDAGVLQRNSGGTAKKKYQAEIHKIDPDVEFPKTGKMKGDNAVKYAAAVKVLAEVKGKLRPKPADPVVPEAPEVAAQWEDIAALIGATTEGLAAAAEDHMNPQFMIAKGLQSRRDQLARELKPLSKPDRTKVMKAVVGILAQHQAVFEAEMKAEAPAYLKAAEAKLKAEVKEQKKITMAMRKMLKTPFEAKDFKFIRGVLHSDRAVDEDRRDKAFNLFNKLAPLFGEKK